MSIQSAHSPVLLGTAESFAVLGGSTVTNTGPTVISGDLGVFPGCEVTGSAQIVITGTIHECDAVAQQAQADLLTAYNAAAGQIPTAQLATELGGQTLTAGVYDSASGTFQITGILTLDAQGDPDAVFIFQTDSTLITASSSQVLLINGAQACNVFWQVGSSATLGTDSSLVGNVLALTSITANTGATVDGRLLALNGAVTLDTNVVTRSECAADNGNGDNGNGDNGGPGPGGTDTGGTDTDTGTVLVTDTDTGTGTGTGEGTGTADDGRALPFTGLGIGLPGVIAMVMLLLGAGLRRIRGGGGTDGSPVGTTLAVRTASTATSARIAREVPPFHARESHQAERVLPFRPRVRLPAVIGGMAFLLAVGLRRRHVG
ncbi:MAG TPA: ice-binding family protein [Solirubrobacterales bacterium]|nr:ice-binding family protein [Solirubrobacterales bacterium]